MYRLIPCLNGICASPSSSATRRIRDTNSTSGVEEVVLLPGGMEYDLLIKDEAIAYPHSASLSEDDIHNLDCSNANNFAFTHYGPSSQDKPNNQDCALSGHFMDIDGKASRFSILADGISNGFGFPQRGAQLSCIAAYLCLKELHEEFNEINRPLNEEDVAAFRESLAKKIRLLLEDDRNHLLSYFEEYHQEPSKISSKIWRKQIKDNPEKWYGNTLLVTFLSPFGGFMVFAGDGGIVLVKGPSAPKDVFRSDASSAISRFVTLGVSRATFLGALISYEDNDDFVEVIMATDGVDRTYQLNDMDLSAPFSAEASLDDLVDQIANLKERVSGAVDEDNYSIGRVFLQLSNQKHSRLIGDSASANARPAKFVDLEEEPEAGVTAQTSTNDERRATETHKKKGRQHEYTPSTRSFWDRYWSWFKQLELSKTTSNILTKANQTEQEATAAQQQAQAAADKATELATAAETAQTQAAQAQADATAAQQEAQAVADKATELAAAAETAQTQAAQAQADVTAAQEVGNNQRRQQSEPEQ